jgi:8-oxo-dGTP diphosphatase
MDEETAASAYRYNVKLANQLFHPGFSVDCVLFGFDDNQMKVLLVKRETFDTAWALPGGGMLHTETAEEAASKTLETRTGLKNIFFRQFHLFSDVNRDSAERKRRILESEGVEDIDNHWFMSQRFITLGFYALVKFEEYTSLRPDDPDDKVAWFNLDAIPEMILDHRQIVDKALLTLRHRLDLEPIGYNLLPEKFTMPELQKLYETLLGTKLERSNFKKRMLSFDILINTQELKYGKGHKPPFLYKFDLDKYQAALQKGLHKSWA